MGELVWASQGTLINCAGRPTSQHDYNSVGVGSTTFSTSGLDCSHVKATDNKYVQC